MAESKVTLRSLSSSIFNEVHSFSCLTIHTSSQLSPQVIPYIGAYIDQEYFTSILPRQKLHCQRACSVPRWSYLVIPQAGTRCQQAYSVPRRVNLLHPFHIKRLVSQSTLKIAFVCFYMYMSGWGSCSNKNFHHDYTFFPFKAWDGIGWRIVYDYLLLIAPMYGILKRIDQSNDMSW